MFDFDQSLSRLSAVTVLCIGDLMLDDVVYGEVARISPEAPAPVIAVKRSEMVIGGATWRVTSPASARIASSSA